MPVTVARADTGAVGSNPTQGMDVLCVGFSVFVYR
jgi:hypothetical protein